MVELYKRREFKRRKIGWNSRRKSLERRKVRKKMRKKTGGERFDSWPYICSLQANFSLFFSFGNQTRDIIFFLTFSQFFSRTKQEKESHFLYNFPLKHFLSISFASISSKQSLRATLDLDIFVIWKDRVTARKMEREREREEWWSGEMPDAS